MKIENMGFIAPDLSLQTVPPGDIHTKLCMRTLSGHQSDFARPGPVDAPFAELVDRLKEFKGNYEDQCSEIYYQDLFNCVRKAAGTVTRLMEVGVFMGGSSVILAGGGARFGMDLDLIDITKNYLLFTYERIRRTFPEYAGKVRLFHGDLPGYVALVLSKEKEARALVQHDGAHDFNQVVRDLCSLSYVRDQVHALTIQDTHLRGMPKYLNFVDAAVYAVFGQNLKFEPLGRKVGNNLMLTTPNRFEGNYFLPEAPEGMYVPIAQNRFAYPHPAIPLSAFLSQN